MSQIEKKQILRKYYYDPKTGFQGPEKLYEKVKEYGIKNF